ncbi:hypothetical protein VPH35_118887 [Triticum aestivum]
MADSGDEAERRRRARSVAARKRGARQWLNHGARPPPAFNRRELDEFELERARRRRASSGNWSAGSSSIHGSAGCSSAGASSSRLVPVKWEPEEAVPDAPPRRGVIGPEDSLPPGQEELLERVVLERSARDPEEMEERIQRELEYERLFLETGLTASQAHASKEADLRVMKAEQAKLYIEVDSDSN